MSVKILPYKKGSRSAKDLAQSMGIKQLKLEGSKWNPRKGDVIVNWGTSRSDHPALLGLATVLNSPVFVANAANKLNSFSLFKEHGVETPEWTTDRKEAESWFDAGKTVVCRQKLTGHSGEGIVIAESLNEMVDAPLYTKYVAKENEFRIHVIGDEAVFVQRKARVREVPDEEVNWKVRNLKGGFIYANQDVQVAEAGKNLAREAVAALSLDFGAVDIVQTKRGKFFVLEVNTACGLSGKTLEIYSKCLTRFIGDL